MDVYIYLQKFFFVFVLVKSLGFPMLQKLCLLILCVL